MPLGGGSGVGGGSGARGIRAGRAFVEIAGDDTLLARALSSAKARVMGLANQLTRLGTIAAVGGTLGLAPIVTTFANFDDQMRMVKATGSATDAELEKLTETARKLGRTTSFTATQVSKLMVELARAGFGADEVDKMTASVLNLARATGTDAALSAGIMSSAIRQFNLDATDASKVADSLTAVSNKTFNTLESVGEALKYLGPVAASLNMDLDDTLGLIGALGNVGLRGSEAGTALRRLPILIASHGKDLERLFGVSGTDALGNARQLVDVLDDIGKVTNAWPDARRAEAMYEFFGLLGITSATVLSRSAKSARELRDEIAGARGVAAATAKEMDAGLGGSLRRLKSSIEGAAISLGDAFAPSLMIVSKNIENTFAAFTRLVGENRELFAVLGVGIITFTMAGAAALTLGLALRGLVATVGLVVLSVKALVVVLGLVLTPVGLLMVDIGLLIALVGRGTGTWTNFATVAAESWTAIAQAIKKGDIELAFEIATQTIKALWYGMLIDMGKAFAEFVVKNRDTIIALGTVLGVWTGAKLGARFGPVGAAFGAGFGGAFGGLGADSLVDAVAGMGHNPEMERRRAAALAELKGLRAFAALPAAGGGGAMGGAALDKKRMQDEFAKLNRQFDAAKGGFYAGRAMQQFGYNDKISEKLGDIKDGRGKLPERIGAAVVEGLKLK